MIKFLKAVFKITWFQVILIGSFSLLKYVANTYHLADKFRWPLLWVGIGMVLLFITAVGIKGIIQDPELSEQDWSERPTNSRTEKVLATVAGWGFAIPVITGFVLFVYILVPTSWDMLIALYCGVVIRNIVDYFKEKQVPGSKKLTKEYREK